MIGRLLLVMVVAATPLFAAMTDSKAMSVAHAMWDDVAAIGMFRTLTYTYWEKQVGVWSYGCRYEFTVLGHAPNTWEAAFAAVPDTSVIGPYSGPVILLASPWDNMAVAGVWFIFDGQPLGPEIVMSPANTWPVTLPLDFTTIPNGVHTLCVNVRDSTGNVGRNEAFVVEVDNGYPSVATSIGPLFPRRGPPYPGR